MSDASLPHSNNAWWISEVPTLFFCVDCQCDQRSFNSTFTHHLQQSDLSAIPHTRWFLAVPLVCSFSPPGDGYCNPENNKPECNYDGGDCCQCTCEVDTSSSEFSDGRWSGCNEFACIDPAAPCVDDDSITVDMLDKCPWVSRRHEPGVSRQLTTRRIAPGRGYFTRSRLQVLAPPCGPIDHEVCKTIRIHVHAPFLDPCFH